MGRPRTPIEPFGEVSFVRVAGGQVQAPTRFRDNDGQVRRVSATGVSRKEAERNLTTVLAQRASHVASGEITADSSFAKLVMPAFERYLLREITMRQADQLIRKLAATKSYTMAKQARTTAPRNAVALMTSPSTSARPPARPAATSCASSIDSTAPSRRTTPATDSAPTGSSKCRSSRKAGVCPRDPRPGRRRHASSLARTRTTCVRTPPRETC